MFGRGRFQNGILIEPQDEFAINPKDTKQLEDFRNKIWFVAVISGCRVCYTDINLE